MKNTFLIRMYIRTSITFLFLLLCLRESPAQKRPQDSAWVLIEKYKDYTGAQKFVERTLAQNLKLSPADKADLFSAKGVALYENKEFGRALTMHDLALKYREKIFGFHSLPVARSWCNISNCQISSFQPTEAYKALKNAQKAAQNLDNPDIKFKILQGFGAYYQSQSQRDSAIYYYHQVLSLQQVYGALPVSDLQNNLVNIAKCYLDDRNTQAAMPYIKQLESLDQNLTAGLYALRLRANIAQQSGEVVRAKHLLRKAIKQWERQNDSEQQEHLFCIMDLSNILSQMGELDEARHLFTQLLYQVEKKKDQKAFQASVHNNYANLLREWKLDSVAIQHYEEALHLFSSKQVEELSAIFLNLASIYLGINDLASAQAYLDEMAAMRTSLETRAAMMLIQGDIFQEKGAHAAAKQTYLKAYKLLSPNKTISSTLFSTLCTRLAQAWAKEGLFDSAMPLLQEALKVLGQTNKLNPNLMPAETAEVLNALAAIRLAQARKTPSKEHWSTAWSAYQKAIHFLQQHQQHLEGRNSLLQAGVNARETFEGMLEVCYELSKQNKHFAKQAFIYADMSKALLFRRLIQDAKAKSFAALPKEYLDSELILQSAIAELSSRLADPHRMVHRSSIEDELADLELQKQQFIREIERKFPRYYQLKYAPLQLDIAELQKKMAADQSLLAYFMAKQYLYVFVLDRSHLFFKRLRLDSTFFSTLDSCYNLMRRPPYVDDTLRLQKLTEKSLELYKLLIRPVQIHLHPKLIIIPDALLHYLPFDALLYAKADHEGPIKDFPFLLKRYAIHYTSSASFIHENKDSTFSGRNFFLAVAPQFSLQKQGLSPLPKAQKEIELIATGFATKKLLVGAAALKSNFILQAPKANIIHLATHGISESTRPDLSYLAFADHRPGLTVQGHLTAAEVYGLQLRANLVFLSACQTALGQWYANEGMLSLSRAFQYAGAKSLVATLWSIPDFQTAQVSNHFYRHLRQGIPKDIALQKAKLDYLGDAEIMEAHPAYWAAFTLSGDISPLPQNHFWDHFGLYTGLMGLLSLLVWWYRKKIQAIFGAPGTTPKKLL